MRKSAQSSAGAVGETPQQGPPGTASPSPPFANDYVQQLFAPWTAMAGMWNAWLETSEVVARERGVESSKLLTRMWDPEFWKAGGLAPLLQEMQDVFSSTAPGRRACF